jgi:CO/xanthine dehydrogenase Mo-binding subunit
MSYTLIGKDFVPPDVLGKVTGKAKYSEDFRADGMLFCRLLLSPMPHARVRSIDTNAALALPGVVAVLTADDLPAPPPPQRPVLTKEPYYVGQPILALAAESETIAQDALELIKLDLEPLPFTVDPLESLYPGGPNARTGGNHVVSQGFQSSLKTTKWTANDYAAVTEGQLPLGEPDSEWSYGDVEAGFKNATLVIDESFVTAAIAHQSMEPRSAMAYWENGKCYLHASCQSQSFPFQFLPQMIGVEPENLVFIAEYCGGGFGSKGSAYTDMTIPAHMAKKTGRPVLMRVSRSEEYFIGSSRPGFQGRIKIGFRADGRITALDLYIVQANGPEGGFNDYTSAADAISLIYTPEAMRWRGIRVQTNTPPTGPQRGPGRNQIAGIIEPIIDKAARELGVDRKAIRIKNNPSNATQYGPNKATPTSAYIKEALEQGALEFNWEEKKRLSGRRNGPKVIGIGIGQAHHPGGASGFDGLVRITPDGILHIHTGVGNLGTYSHSGTSRVAAETLKYDWDHCVIERGDSSKHLPWNLGQFGSNTSFTMTRTNYVAAMDAIAKLKEIAAKDLGGAPEDFDIGDEKVFLKSDPARHLTYAAAAQRAIELGGKYDGHEAPGDINPMTKRSVAALAGTGLIGVAKDNLELKGSPPAFGIGYMQIELDTETGVFEIQDYVAVVDCGTVIHPQNLANQIKGGAVMGIGMATLERHVYDPQNGLPANVGLYQTKPPSYLDVPPTMKVSAVDKPDPMNPIGARGIGEPVMGCASAALISAISDALGGHLFNRAPVATDMIVNAANGRAQSHKPLQTNTF